MKTPDFQAFVAQLGELSESQQQVVVAALTGKGSAGDSIRLIERNSKRTCRAAIGQAVVRGLGQVGQRFQAPQVQVLREDLHRADRHAAVESAQA